MPYPFFAQLWGQESKATMPCTSKQGCATSPQAANSQALAGLRGPPILKFRSTGCNSMSKTPSVSAGLREAVIIDGDVQLSSLWSYSAVHMLAEPMSLPGALSSWSFAESLWRCGLSKLEGRCMPRLLGLRV